MASDAQINANRANAQRSTGPRTEQGKARSSQNAVTHGLNCSGFIVTEDRQQEFEDMRAELIEQHQPSTGAEWQIFLTMLHAAWGQRRVWRLEDELFDGQTDPLGVAELDRQMDRLARYEVRFERAYYRAIKELGKMKTNGDLRRMLPTTMSCEMSDLSDAEKVLSQEGKGKSDGEDLAQALMSYVMSPMPGSAPSAEPAGGPRPPKPPDFRKPPGSFGSQ